MLYQPNGVYATGVDLILDVQTGRTVLTTRGELKRKTPRELLWIDPPGAPPHQNGGTLSLIRLDPQTLKKQRLDLPLPHPPGIAFDEHPTIKVRVVGDRIEAMYRGFPEPSGPMTYFLARYHWRAGPSQKPEIQWLDRPEWPK